MKSRTPDMVLQPSEQPGQICVEFCAADKTKLCHEYSHFGSCPRGATCRWAHAMIETFVIQFILAPLGPWECSPDGQATQAPETMPASEPKATGRWQPSRPPMTPPVEEASAGQSDMSAEEGSSPKAVKMEAMKKLAPDTRPKNPRLASRKSWADMDFSDDDA